MDRDAEIVDPKDAEIALLKRQLATLKREMKRQSLQRLLAAERKCFERKQDKLAQDSLGMCTDPKGDWFEYTGCVCVCVCVRVFCAPSRSLARSRARERESFLCFVSSVPGTCHVQRCVFLRLPLPPSLTHTH
jgi:hypothetical protein